MKKLIVILWLTAIMLLPTLLANCTEQYDTPNISPVKKVKTEIKVLAKKEKKDTVQVDTIKTIPLPKGPTKGTKAFTIVDDLRIRKAPNFQSEVITKLKEGTSVIYMGEQSKNIEEVELRGEKKSSPFYKVKLENGKIAWVFGAAVRFEKAIIQ